MTKKFLTSLLFGLSLFILSCDYRTAIEDLFTIAATNEVQSAITANLESLGELAGNVVSGLGSLVVDTSGDDFQDIIDSVGSILGGLTFSEGIASITEDDISIVSTGQNEYSVRVTLQPEDGYLFRSDANNVIDVYSF